jgi:hypothetical protein
LRIAQLISVNEDAKLKTVRNLGRGKRCTLLLHFYHPAVNPIGADFTKF